MLSSSGTPGRGTGNANSGAEQRGAGVANATRSGATLYGRSGSSERRSKGVNGRKTLVLR